MSTTDSRPDNHSNTLLGLGFSEGLGPLLEGWANVECVRFVNRSTGQRTTETVSRDGLLDLMRAAQAEERERCARIVERINGWIGTREIAAEIRGETQVLRA